MKYSRKIQWDFVFAKSQSWKSNFALNTIFDLHTLDFLWISSLSIYPYYKDNLQISLLPSYFHRFFGKSAFNFCSFLFRILLLAFLLILLRCFL